MPNGKDYILFYLKMLVESVDHDGNLRFNDTIPYNENMLSTITSTNIDIVRSAMKVFTELKMIEVLGDETIFMAEVEKMMGTETYWAEQKRKQRVGQCPQNVQLMSNVSNQEIDKDLDKDLDKEKELKSSCQKNKFSDDSLPIILSQKLFDRIKSNNANTKKPDMQSWAKHIDLMLRIDKRTSEEIEAVIDWCQQDSFWYANILSTDKLRKQFDKLTLASKTNINAKYQKPKSTDSNQHILDEIGDEYFT